VRASHRAPLLWFFPVPRRDMAGAVSSTRAAWSKDEEVAAHSSREPGLEARRQGTPIPVVQLVTAALISYLGSRPSDAVRTCTHSKHTAISMHMH